MDSPSFAPSPGFTSTVPSAPTVSSHSEIELPDIHPASPPSDNSSSVSHIAVSAHSTTTFGTPPPYAFPNSDFEPLLDHVTDTLAVTQKEESQEEVLQTRLKHKRLELDHEIEEFRLRKEAQYRRFEASLQAELRERTRKKDRDFGADTVAQKTELPVDIKARPDRPSSDEAGSPKPIDLGGAFLKQRQRKEVSVGSDLPAEVVQLPDISLRSPPFEKELQVAGLFAPSYLPLLEDCKVSPNVSGKMADNPAPSLIVPVSMSSHTENSSTASRDNSPGHLPTSSLRSPSNGSFRHSTKNPKSPKKVTFQFEDEAFIPSRSSPPAVKILRNFCEISLGNEDDYDEVDDTDLEGVPRGHVAGTGRDRQSVSGPDEDVIEQTCGLVISAPVMLTKNQGERCHGDALVTPLEFDSTGRSNFAIPLMNDNGITKALSAESWASNRSENNEWQGAFNFVTDDDDDGLFDLDETVPDAPQHSPPHRDLSPLMEAQMPAQQIPPTVCDIDLPPSLQGPFVPKNPFLKSISQSVPSFDPLAFGKSPVFSPQFSSKPAGILSSSFSLVNSRTDSKFPSSDVQTVASSLPAKPDWGPVSGEDTGRFRRRSINKYIPSPPPEKTERSSIRTIPEDAELPGSTFATSLPVAITPRISSMRSPPPSTSPLAKSSLADIPDTMPLSARPSPEASSITFHVDGDAELLAASPPPPSRNSSEVESYMKTARFPSANLNGTMMSPYRTKFAQELAEKALQDGNSLGESIVGGVDGTTGFDPESFSVRGRAGSFASPSLGTRAKVWSLSARLAAEEESGENAARK